MFIVFSNGSQTITPPTPGMLAELWITFWQGSLKVLNKNSSFFLNVNSKLPGL